MKEFRGTGVALVTPFDNEGQIDFKALVKLVRYQIDNGVDYLVVLGTTGETATLTDEEKRLVKKCVLDTCNGSVPVVLGLGGNNTQRILEDLEEEDLSGFSAILSVSPYYNKPSQEGIYQHYKLLSEKSPLPLILYNVPPRTGSNIEVETVVRLSNDCKNIIGIKEAAGDFEQVLELIRKTPEDFLIISGEDKLALPLVLAGGDGVISVIGQGLPEAFSRMIKMGLEGKSREAYDIFYTLTESIDLVFAEGNPSGIKSMLNSLHISEPFVRLPLVPASSDLRQKINTFVNHF
ncbi:4-hydroxy-tetrahydrodipicolinate synthase [Lutimonas saemankumensis]|uniref:4-hydroxy-tetrahydrodipicolinate synthase n=1 Tax=Lutimonas saemankumensis TaxID=483016 RepID=UPI001CD44943|nr:4-hydroxy-tetrahydrodipicolinate synthase [Lutimonas saemankumensis]MCA0932169.1 4-hydroxy-tetrahydrodipicolinate synthase [Lutimonas saemankumensis]